MADVQSSSFDSSRPLSDLPERLRGPRDLASCLSPPVSKSQSLIDHLTGKLESKADNVSLSKDKVLEIIQQLRHSGESTADEKCCRELTQVKEELKIVRYYGRLGDYAGKVYKDLGRSMCDSEVGIDAEGLVKGIEENTAKGSDLFEDTVDNLPQNSQDSNKMPSATVKYAVSQYTARNKVCHVGFRQLQADGEWSQLGDHISKDLAELTEILPDDQLQHRDKWRHIIEYYRDSNIYRSPDGTWVPIPEEDLYHPCPSRPFDVSALPKDLRPAQFLAGRFRSTGLEEPRMGVRRISDPASQQYKRKRDDELPLCEPVAKRARHRGELNGLQDDAPWGTGDKKELQEYLDLLQRFRDKLPGDCSKHIREKRGWINASLSGPSGQGESKTARKRAKQKRRAAKVSGR
ncbi:MAG: hypothetical protein Q9176_001324 [Flavoplaca citrina]